MLTKYLLALGALALAAPIHAEAATGPGIDWEVVNRFRLFDKVEGPAVDDMLGRLDGAFVPAEQYRPLFDFLTATPGVRTSNVRGDRYDPAYLYPARYEIRVTATGISGARCTWFIGERLAAELASCSGQVLALKAAEDNRGAAARISVSVEGTPGIAAATDVVLRDELIVAMGDSYISGEGNPDVPTKFHARNAYPRYFRGYGWGSGLKAGDAKTGDATPAIWWNRGCHRSLLSWPVTATLIRAARNRHRAVTLVHLGCSGDEVDDGMLRHRAKLPGGGSETEGQLTQLDKLLDGPKDRAGKRRRVDAVLLSVGGNDIGFAPVLTGIILPPNGWRISFMRQIIVGRGGAACAYLVEALPLRRMCGRAGLPPRHGKDDRRSAQQRLTELPEKYGRLAGAFDALGVSAGAIIQASYANPLFDENGEVCRTPLTDAEIEALQSPRREEEAAYSKSRFQPDGSGFEGLVGQVPRIFRGGRSWRFQMLYGPDADLGEVLDTEPDSKARCDWNPYKLDSELCQAFWVWSSLNRALRVNAEARGWTVLDSFQSKVRNHGWCRSNKDFPLGLPVLGRDGRWTAGGHPSTFDAYAAERPRWFRTGNDSLMTEWVSKKDFHRGTMHPTYRAHLEIAQSAIVALDQRLP